MPMPMSNMLMPNRHRWKYLHQLLYIRKTQQSNIYHQVMQQANPDYDTLYILRVNRWHSTLECMWITKSKCHKRKLKQTKRFRNRAYFFCCLLLSSLVPIVRDWLSENQLLRWRRKNTNVLPCRWFTKLMIYTKMDIDQETFQARW